MFNYESPVKVLHDEISMQVENEIMKAVCSIGVTVDKEELLKALKYDREQYEKGYRDGLSVGKWIPVSERLPEDNEKSEYYDSVIVTLDNGRVADGCYRNHDKEWWVDAEDGEHYSINATGHVIAWMPMPDPFDMRKKV